MTGTTIPTAIIGQREVGYVFLAFLSDKAQRRVGELQQRLVKKLPGVLWPLPPNILHITLCELFEPKDYGQDKDELFRQQQQKYKQSAADILGKARSISVDFSTIVASPGGIFIRGEDNGNCNALRALLVERLPLPDHTKAPPNIVHTTIARYTAATDLAVMQGIVKEQNLSFTETITKFSLVRCSVQPLDKYQVLQTYPLG